MRLNIWFTIVSIVFTNSIQPDYWLLSVWIVSDYTNEVMVDISESKKTTSRTTY